MFRRLAWVLLWTIPLAAQQKEQPVALVLRSASGQVVRAGSELPLAAIPGDLLFVGDALLGGQGSATFLFCPDKSSQQLNAGGRIVFEAARFQIQSGAITNRQSASACLLPMVERAPSASRSHYGEPRTRSLEPPASQTGGFEARLQALPADQRTALQRELGPVDQALAANPQDHAARLARATLLDKYGLHQDATEEFSKLSESWSGAEWTRQLVHGEPAPKPPEEPGAPGRTYALVVGISKYQKLSEDEQLQFAHADAQTFADYLKSPRGGALPAENISLLINERATTSAIRTSIESFLKARAGKNDTLILFVAAHGTEADTSSGREAFIVTYDSDPQDLASTALPMADIQALMHDQLSKVGRIILYIDVCHAGVIGTIKSNAVNGSVEQLFEEEGDLFGFLASRPREFSIESERFGGGHGAFTYFLLRALNGDADGFGAGTKDGIISVNEVIDYVRDQVRDATKNKQHPVERVNVSGDPELAEVSKDGILLAGWTQAANPNVAMRALPASAPSSASLAIRGQADVRVSGQIEVFEKALRDGNLLAGTPGNAFDLLEGLRQQASQEEFRLLEEDLRVALENKGQQILLRYLTGDQIPQTRADFEAGRRHFQAAETLAANSPFLEGREAFCEGRTLIFNKRYSDAVSLLERAVRLDPNGAYSYNALGIAYLEQANYVPAGQAFRDAARRAPYWAYPLHNLALVQTEMGDYQAAIQSYQKAMLLAPRYSYLPYNLGLVYQRLNRRKDAEHSYRQALALTPGLAEANNALGALAAAQGKTREAESNYREALSKNPELLAARHNLALLLSTQPQGVPEALSLLRENVAKDPEYIASRLLLAEVLQRQKHTPEAIEQYRAVLAAKPDYVAARISLAESLIRAGSRQEALEQIESALERQPNNALALERLGDIQKSLGHAPEATAAYQKALATATDGKARKAIRAKMR